MKTFNLFDYKQSCPKANAVENAVNNCDSIKKNLEKVMNVMELEIDLHLFFMACILYWAETDRYDERNKWAVYVSREIVKDFSCYKNLAIPEDILKEAFGFTTFAHRYLQNELFKVILEYFKKNDEDGIFRWYNEAEFVYNKTATGVIRYSEYKN